MRYSPSSRTRSAGRLPAFLLCLFAALLFATAAHADEGYTGAAGHAEAAHGDHGGHGGHGGHKITNWFSFDYGPDRPEKNGPFGFMVLNFVLLIYLLVKLGKKPVTEYLDKRHTSIRDNLTEAQELRRQAKEKLEQIEAKIANLDAEIAEIKQHVADDAEEEKQRIIAAAEQEAERIVQNAEKTLDKELDRARRRLEAEAVDAALGAAEKLIKQKITDKDRKQLNEEYFEQLTSSGGSN